MIDIQKLIIKLLAISGFFLVSLSYNSASTDASPTIPEDRHSAVVLAYHMVGEDHLPEQSIRLSQFEEQMRELKEADYNVMPRDDVIRHFKAEKELPPRSVVITFDGAHKSLLDKAAPILQDYEFPFTVFVAADHAAQKKRKLYVMGRS